MSANESCKCECSIAGHCSRRNRFVAGPLWRKCNGGQCSLVDKHFEKLDSSPRWNSATMSQIGSHLERVFAEDLGVKTSCSDCKKDIVKLNMMTVEEVKESIDDIAESIAARAYDVADTWYKKLAVVVDGVMKTNLTTAVIIKCIEKAIEKEIADIEKFRQRERNMAGRGTSLSKCFKPSGTARFIKSSELQEDVKKLMAMLPSDITAIAGVARSGLNVATMLAMYLQLPMLTIRQTKHDVIQTGNGWRLGGSSHVNPSSGHVLVVDDTVMTGNSLKAIAPLLKSTFNRYTTAAVYVNPAAGSKPDIWAVDLPWPHILEWNVFNSVLSSSLVLDFDGILCMDCPPDMDDDGEKYKHFLDTAKPLYLPRKAPVPMIVTARLEKYRHQTIKWLDRHGVRCDNLVMHPARTLGERRKSNIAAYKARFYRKFAMGRMSGVKPLIFFESDDRQASQIAKYCGDALLVVCPHTGNVYGS